MPRRDPDEKDSKAKEADIYLDIYLETDTVKRIRDEATMKKFEKSLVSTKPTRETNLINLLTSMGAIEVDDFYDIPSLDIVDGFSTKDVALEIISWLNRAGWRAGNDISYYANKLQDMNIDELSWDKSDIDEIIEEVTEEYVAVPPVQTGIIGVFICNKKSCGKSNIKLLRQRMRAADEGINVTFECLECGNKWIRG